MGTLRGYESALWWTRMLLPNAGRKVANWLLCGFIRCNNILTARLITAPCISSGAVGMMSLLCTFFECKIHAYFFSNSFQTFVKILIILTYQIKIDKFNNNLQIQGNYHQMINNIFVLLNESFLFTVIDMVIQLSKIIQMGWFWSNLKSSFKILMKINFKNTIQSWIKNFWLFGSHLVYSYLFFHRIKWQSFKIESITCTRTSPANQQRTSARKRLWHV